MSSSLEIVAAGVGHTMLSSTEDKLDDSATNVNDVVAADTDAAPLSTALIQSTNLTKTAYEKLLDSKKGTQHRRSRGKTFGSGKTATTGAVRCSVLEQLETDTATADNGNGNVVAQPQQHHLVHERKTRNVTWSDQHINGSDSEEDANVKDDDSDDASVDMDDASTGTSTLPSDLLVGTTRFTRKNVAPPKWSSSSQDSENDSGDVDSEMPLESVDNEANIDDDDGSSHDDDEESVMDTTVAVVATATTVASLSVKPAPPKSQFLRGDCSNADNADDDDLPAKCRTAPKPTLEDLLASTNDFFQNKDDQTPVSVKQLLMYLSTRYGCDSADFSKPVRLAVRTRLIELIEASLSSTTTTGRTSSSTSTTSAAAASTTDTNDEDVPVDMDSDNNAGSDSESSSPDLQVPDSLSNIVEPPQDNDKLDDAHQTASTLADDAAATKQADDELVDQTSAKATASSSSNKKTLNLENVLASTERLFQQVEDKMAVTLKDVHASLMAEYNCTKLGKSIKAAIRQRLTDLVDEEAEKDERDNDKALKSTAATMARSNKIAPVSTRDGNEELDLDDVLSSTDALFEQVEDKTAVTVKDIITSLLAQYQRTKFDKPTKAAIKERLVELATASASAAARESNDDDDEEANVESDVGDSDRSDESADEKDDGDDEFDSDEERPKSRSNRRRASAKTKTSSSSGKSTTKTSRSRSSNKASQTKLALRVHAEQRRKRRLEELRVRNEELLVHQSAQDQERAAQIAAKFETNTDDLRMERLEKRLDLLQKLNQKRIVVCSQSIDVTLVKVEQPDVPRTSEELTVESLKETVVPETADLTEDAANTSSQALVDPCVDVAAESSEDEDDSDDDMELEIEGNRSLRFNATSKPAPSCDVFSLLDKADACQLGNGKAKPKLLVSPGRASLNARAALKHKLKHKQRTMGNLWLARELGYKNEHEHLQECLNHVNVMREQVLLKEKERVQANERAAMRQKMLREEEQPVLELSDNVENGNSDSEDEEYKEEVDAAEGDEDEDDEEQALAKELEHDQSANESKAERQADVNAAEQPSTSTDDALNETGPTRSEPDSDLQATDGSVPMDEDCQGASGPSAQPGLPVLEEPSPDEKGEKEESQGDFAELSSCPIDDDVPVDPTDSEDLNQATEVSFDGSGGDKGALNQATEVSFDGSGGDKDDAFPEADTDEADLAVTDDPPAPSSKKPKGPRNSAWKAMLQQDAAKAKKKKKSSLVEEEADEEEEEEVAGLEDFGFVVHKKKADGDEEEDHGDFDEDDLEHVVDDVSDDEGDEEAGKNARKAMEAMEEKKRHEEMIRRMRDGYDGRRGGIAVGGAGARGIHRFDQLVAADNREDAKQLGLLNDDEIDSDNEGGGDKTQGGGDEEIEDEAALLDQMLKDRFLHRSSAIEEENFSEDEDDDVSPSNEGGAAVNAEEMEKLEQERLAKRFSKRARMHRLLENHGHEEEFSQALLVDEDTTLKLELQQMKNGLVRKRSQSSSSRSNSVSAIGTSKPLAGASAANSTTQTLTTSLLHKGGSLAIALQASRRSTSQKSRTSFVRSASGGSSEVASSFQKVVAYNHVVFHSSTNSNSRSQMSSSRQGSTFAPSNGGASRGVIHNVGAAKAAGSNKRPASLFSQLGVAGFQKKPRKH